MMKTFIHRIMESRKKAKDEKLQAYRWLNIMWCLGGSDIKYEDLTPIPDEEYDQIVAKLEERVNREKADEPLVITNDNVMPDGTVCRSYTLPNIYRWSEVIESMKTRVRDAYYVKNHPCEKCKTDNTIFFCFRSSDESWRELCGREGYMLICPDCLTQLDFKYYIMN